MTEARQQAEDRIKPAGSRDGSPPAEDDKADRAVPAGAPRPAGTRDGGEPGEDDTGKTGKGV